MACMTHQCRGCGKHAFNNGPAPKVCKGCGGCEFTSWFDEECA